MKAPVAAGLGQGFLVHEITIGEPRGREVLVNVKASGLRHSDLHLVETDYGYPMQAVFGHEVAGRRHCSSTSASLSAAVTDAVREQIAASSGAGQPA